MKICGHIKSRFVKPKLMLSSNFIFDLNYTCLTLQRTS